MLDIFNPNYYIVPFSCRGISASTISGITNEQLLKFFSSSFFPLSPEEACFIDKPYTPTFGEQNEDVLQFLETRHPTQSETFK